MAQLYPERVSASLPNRQLRNNRNKKKGERITSLPNRQLRKIEGSEGQCYSASLPNRQLRNLPEAPED